jgi:dienelactone hydrolase
MDHYGEGITGFRNAFVDGVDPFQSFVEDGRAVLDRCMAEGVAFPGRVAVCGTSRGGYMALRLLASDTRIAAGAGFAPVTDWRHLREFSGDRERADVAALRLHTHVDGYIDRAVYMAIGAHDDRVDTVSCVRLYLDILDARKRQGRDRAGVDFSCTDDPGHTCSERWYRKGAEFLIERLEGVG